MYGYMYMWPFEGRGKIDEEANGGSNSDGLFVTGELRPCKDGMLDYRIGWTSFIHLIGYVIFIVTESGLNVVRGLMQLFWGIMLSSINFKAFVYDLQHVYFKKKIIPYSLLGIACWPFPDVCLFFFNVSHGMRCMLFGKTIGAECVMFYFFILSVF